MNNFAGVSEDEDEDVMEEDYRPFEDALVNAEDDLQQDDIAANDVQAERKSGSIHKGTHSSLSLSFLVKKNGTPRGCLFRYRSVPKSGAIKPVKNKSGSGRIFDLHIGRTGAQNQRLA